MEEEIAFENGRISNFQWLMTLTLTFRSGHTAYCGRTYVQTDGWTFETHFIRSTQKSRPKNEIMNFARNANVSLIMPVKIFIH